MTAGTVRVRGTQLVVSELASWERLRDHPGSRRGEWDPATGEGVVEYETQAEARRAAEELLLEGHLPPATTEEN